jgi:hypothetical protein
MRIDDNGEISFQDGGFVFGGTYTGDYTPGPTGTPSDRLPGSAGPNDPNFNWGLYNSLVRDPYMGGYTGFGPDLTAALEGSLNPTGIMLDQDAIAKAIAEYQALQGLVQTAPSATVTAPPVRTLDDDIRDFFATKPTAQEVFDAMQANNVSPEAVISAMGFDPESAMAQYNMFLNPANAPVSGAATGAATGAAAPTTVTGPSTAAPAGGGGLFDLLPGPIQGAVTKVGEVADKVLIGAGDLLGGFDPSLVVLNPVDPSATVVFGTPSGNTTPTIVGNMPTSGAPIGVVTGNPILDYVIGKVFSRSPPGQSNPGIVDIIKDVILEEVGEATGVNAGAVASAAQGDVGGLIDAATKVVVGVNKSVAETDEKYKTQEEINRAATGTDQVTDLLEREPTNVDVTDPFPLEPGGTTTGSETDDLINLIGGPGPDMGPNKVIDLVGGPGPDMGPIRTTTTTTPVTGTDTDDLINLIGGPGPDMGPIKTTATDTTKKKVDDTTVTDDTTKKKVDDTTVTDDTTKKKVDDTTVTDDTTKKKVDDTTVVEEDVPPKVVSPDGPVTPPKVTTVTPLGTPGVIPTPIRQPQTAQGMYSVGTEQVGVADIGTQYDLNASLLENIMRILAEGEAGAEETELYGGGSVNGYNATDEIIKLLRG